MLSNSLDASVGENKEFAVDGTKTVTIYIDNTNTSANDTDTKKYFDNQLYDLGAAQNEAKAFFLRNDKTIKILSMNGTEFTDPVEVTLNKGHKETWDKAWLTSLTIRTSQATGTTTNIKIRVK